MSNILFDNKYKLLGIKSVKEIFDSENFDKNDFNELYKIGWSDKEIFDLIEHAGFMLKSGKILIAYTITN